MKEKGRKRKADVFRRAQMQEKTFERFAHAKRSKIVTNLQARAISRLSSKKVAKAFYIWRNETEKQRREYPKKAEVHFKMRVKPKLLKRRFFCKWKIVSEEEKRFQMLGKRSDAQIRFENPQGYASVLAQKKQSRGVKH